LKIGIPSGNPVPIDRIVFASRNYFHFHLALGCVQRLMAARTSLCTGRWSKQGWPINFLWTMYVQCAYKVLTCTYVELLELSRVRNNKRVFFTPHLEPITS
jgi:hypothetical protein